MRIGKFLLTLIALVVLVNLGLYYIVARRSSAEVLRPVQDDSEVSDLHAQLEELEKALALQLELQRDIVRVLREESDRWRAPPRAVPGTTNATVVDAIDEATKTTTATAQSDVLTSSVADKADRKPLTNGDVEQNAPPPKESDLDVLPVLMLACNRAEFVTRSLDELIKVRGTLVKQHPIIVSQDCRDAETERAIRRRSDDIAAYIQQPDQSGFNLPPNQHNFEGYYRIARHYRFAIESSFAMFNRSKGIIIVEDDLSYAPDFFEYFRAGTRLMEQDNTIWCVSSWNDNGKSDLVVQNASLLHRTDFFPGLGWLLTRSIWTELAPRWPRAYWDDWMRQNEQRKGRACIRPELGRTSTFGRAGVSNGQFFEKFLQYVKHTDELVRFTELDLTFLLKERYDKAFVTDVYKGATKMTLDQVQAAVKSKSSDWTKQLPIRIEYSSQSEFDTVASAFGLMRDYKVGVPRTAYLGVVPFAAGGRRVYLAPRPEWKGYDEAWKSPS